MSREFGKTLGHAGVYTIGIILSRAVSFIMLPIYTRYLSTADYGVLELLEITVDVVSIVAGVGVLNGFSKFYYQCANEDEKKELVSTIFILIGTFYLVSCSLGAASSGAISTLVFGSAQYRTCVLISFSNLFFMILFHTNMYYLRTMQKSVLFVVVSSIDLAIKLSLNVLFVVYMGLGVIGVLVSTLVSYVLVSAGMSVYAFSHVGFRFSREQAGRLIRFGAPFILSGFGAFLLTYSDRFFLNHYTDLSSVGVYSLAYKFGFLLMMFPVNPLMNIWMVQRFELVGKEGYQKVFNQFLTWFSIITLGVALFVGMIVRDVLKIMAAPAFWEAYRLVPVILMAYFFQASTDFFNFGIYQSGKTKHIAYGTLIAAVVIVALSFLLIPRYGGAGAAWATMIAFFVRLVYFYVASQKLHRIEYELTKPAMTAAVVVFVYALYYLGSRAFPSMDKVYLSPLGVLGLFVLFLYMLSLLNIVSRDERSYIAGIVRSPIKAIAELRNQFT